MFMRDLLPLPGSTIIMLFPDGLKILEKGNLVLYDLFIWGKSLLTYFWGFGIDNILKEPVKLPDFDPDEAGHVI